jgi:hypothetical protein
MYKVIGADGKEYGPISLEQLKRWVAEGRIGRQSGVQEAGAAVWRPAGEILELSAAFLALGVGPSGPNSKSMFFPPAQPQQGLAVVSFVLGLMSFVCVLGLLSGVPAIICGHLARSRARRLPAVYGGSGLALAGLILGYTGTIVPLLIFPALYLAATPSTKTRAEINCVNHMKQIGLAFRVWEVDNSDLYPFNVSTNQGGSYEFCQRGPDGFDRNAVWHFRVISNELSTPRILACPADSKQPARDWAYLQATNISYNLRSGTNVSSANPKSVLLVCPIHGSVLYTDGSVQRTNAAR